MYRSHSHSHFAFLITHALLLFSGRQIVWIGFMAVEAWPLELIEDIVA